jgi:hypothetical protein
MRSIALEPLGCKHHDARINIAGAPRAEEVDMAKGFTVRLSDDDAAELEAVARVDGVPVAEEIRRAIGDLVAERRADTEFQARLRRSIEENQAILDRLAR